ncbi:MFS transporter [Leucobacter komagatae]|uniref:MFS transporter n=1 Tax=Leucobacter komagatae TaxID=55969 RepID=UPI0005AC95D1|nr:MFS transporter [Leucobacter komagatae]
MKESARTLLTLIVSQLLAGVGVASGVAVGGLLAEGLSGTVAIAGFAQTSAVLGAGLSAIPLAQLAQRKGRSVALTTGYTVAVVGAGIVLLSPRFGLVALFVGLALFGVATAAGLQARFAASEAVAPQFGGRAMSIVLWSTTVGSVAGPNLSQLGSDVGELLGIAPLSGPFIFSLVAFAGAAILLSVFLGGREPQAPAGPRPASQRVGTMAVLESAVRSPGAVVGLLSVVTSHTVMVAIMVMTPMHMTISGHGLDAVGIVISVHIFGMYGASPIFGWLTDLLGEIPVIFIGVGISLGAVACGVVAASQGDDMMLVMIALALLGLGWSAGIIGGSALLTRSTAPEQRVQLQGVSDSLMNFAAAAAAACSGLVLELGGFELLNAAAGALLLPLLVVSTSLFVRHRNDTSGTQRADEVGD